MFWPCWWGECRRKIVSLAKAFLAAVFFVLFCAIIPGVVLCLLFCPCWWGEYRRKIVSRAKAFLAAVANPPRGVDMPSPNHDEMTLELHKAHVEATLITRKVVSADDVVASEDSTGTPSERHGKVIESLSSRLPTYSSLAAIGFTKIFRSRVELTETQQEGLEMSPAIPMGSSEEQESERQTSESQPSSTSNGGGRKEASRDKVDDHPDEQTVKNRRKGNIVARPVSTSTRSSDTYDDRSGCEICGDDYKVGEDVCWSPNDECIHVFHKECIVHWLMTNPDSPSCPDCRRNYLSNNDEES